MAKLTYDYRFIIFVTALIIIVPLALYILFPYPFLFTIILIVIPLLFILLHYVSFIQIEENCMILFKLWKKRTLSYKDIECLIIEEGSFFNNSIVKMHVITKKKPLVVHFGNIPYSEARKMVKMLEGKIKVIRF